MHFDAVVGNGDMPVDAPAMHLQVIAFPVITKVELAADLGRELVHAAACLVYTETVVALNFQPGPTPCK